MVLKVVEVGRVEKAIRPGSVEGEEVAEAGRTSTGRRARVVSLELRGAEMDVSLDRALPQPRLRRQIDHRRDLLAVLRRDVPIDHFHRLEDPRVDGVRERDPDLIRDRLAVHDIALFAVRPLEVVAAVFVLGEAGRLHDQGLHAPRRVGGRGVLDEGLVDVEVGGGRIGLENGRAALRFDADVFGNGLEREGHRNIDRRGASDVECDVLRLKSLDLHVELVGVEGNVEEEETAVLAGPRLRVKAGDVVSEEERDSSERLPVGTGDRPADRAGGNRRPSSSARHREEKEDDRHGVKQGSKASFGHVEIS